MFSIPMALAKSMAWPSAIAERRVLARILEPIPARRARERPERVLELLPAVKDAVAQRRMQPFVRTRRIEVAADVLPAEFNLSGRMGAVEERPEAFRSCERTHLLRGSNEACRRRDVRKGNDARAARNRRLDAVQESRRVGQRSRDFDFGDFDAVSLRAQPPRF